MQTRKTIQDIMRERQEAQAAQKILEGYIEKAEAFLTLREIATVGYTFERRKGEDNCRWIHKELGTFQPTIYVSPREALLSAQYDFISRLNSMSDFLLELETMPTVQVKHDPDDTIRGYSIKEILRAAGNSHK